MECCNGTIRATYEELTGGFMSKPTLDYYIRKGAIKIVRRGCYGTPALYDIGGLSEKKRSEFKLRYTSPEAQARAFVDTIALDNMAAYYYETVVIEGARGLTHEKRMLYTNSASILNAIQAHLMAAADEQRKVGKSRRVKMSEYWEKMAKFLPTIADVFPHVLPENPRVLQRKYLKYVQGGKPNYDTLISGKFRNKNAAKIATPEQIAWLTKLLSYHTNLDCQEIAEYYNGVADKNGWEKVDRRIMFIWLRKLGWAVNAGRHGAKEYLNRYAMQNKRFAPTAPMLFWTLDGWAVERYYKKRTEGKRGGRTAY